MPKQDCERKAFYRLAKRLKNTFKRLPICILADSLYACEGIFNQCEQYKWKYLFRFKEGSIKSVRKEFDALKEMEEASSKHDQIAWVNDITYRELELKVLEYRLETEKDTKQFTFITNIRIIKNKSRKLINTGRSRWKIENEGFNRQKNLKYHIEHASSRNYNAMKNHYLLTQITDILMLLHEHGSKILKRIKKKVKEISSNLLEAFRGQTLTNEDIAQLDKPIQMRFT